MYEILANWGYNKQLFPTAARTFVLSTHTNTTIQLNVVEMDKTYENLDDTISQMILKRFGEHMVDNEGNKKYNGDFECLMKTHELSSTFSFGIKNLT